MIIKEILLNIYYTFNNYNCYKIKLYNIVIYKFLESLQDKSTRMQTVYHLELKLYLQNIYFLVAIMICLCFLSAVL